MRWLSNTHVRRYHRHYKGSGHLWQGRFKAFPIEQDTHLLTVVRYVERNPLRAEMVERAEAWPWSSLAGRLGIVPCPPWQTDGPVPLPKDYAAWVQEAQTPGEVDRLRRSVERGTPFGSEAWQTRTATRLCIKSSLRPRGRPKKA